jgi:hypothetical protein
MVDCSTCKFRIEHTTVHLFNYLENDLLENVLDTKWVSFFLHLLFETFFSPVSSYQETLKIYTETHVGLHVVAQLK